MAINNNYDNNWIDKYKGNDNANANANDNANANANTDDDIYNSSNAHV